MLYRVLIGIIPTVLIALFMTGAIPLGSVLPTQEYRSSAVRAADGKEAKEEAGKPYRARTPEGIVSQRIGVLSPDHIEMMEDNMKAVDDMHREIQKIEDRERRGVASNWEARPGGGWGRPN